mgnify:CR=1 FL=1
MNFNSKTTETTKKFSIGGMTAVSVILTAAAARLLPHPPNVTPIIAMGLLAGSHLGRNANESTTRPSWIKRGWTKLQPYLLPLLAMLLSDLAIQAVTGQGFHRSMPAVYIAILCAVIIGKVFTSTQSTNTPSFALRIGLSTVLASTVFFLITNFSVWAFSGFYPKTGAGLTLCFSAAIPFYRNSLIGDLCWTTALFGTLYFGRFIIRAMLSDLSKARISDKHIAPVMKP